MHLSTCITVPDRDALPALATNRQSFRRSLLTADRGLMESRDRAGSRISDDKYNGSWHIRLRGNSPKTRLLTFFPAVCFILTGDGYRIYTAPPEKSSRWVLNILFLPPSISSCGAEAWIIQHTTTDTLQMHILTLCLVLPLLPLFFFPILSSCKPFLTAKYALLQCCGQAAARDGGFGPREMPFVRPV